MTQKFLAALVLLLTLATSVAAQSTTPRPGQVSGSVSVSPVTGAGSITANGQNASLTLAGYGAASIVVTGTWTGTLTFQGSVDGVTFTTITAFPLASTTGVTTTTANGSWTMSTGGLHSVRVLATAAWTGTAAVALRGTLTGGAASGGGGGGGGGDASAANQTTTIGHVDGIEALLGTANTALQIIDNAISGTGVNVSQMNGVAVTMGNGASGTGVQRVTIASDSTGVIGVTSATLATSALQTTLNGHVDGLETLVGTSNTSLASILAKLPTVGTAGSSSTNVVSVQGIASGTALPISGSISCSNCSGSGASIVDNSAFTFGTTSVAPIGGVFDDVSPVAVTENNSAGVRITAQKALHVNLRTAAGVEIAAMTTTEVAHDAALTAGSTVGTPNMFRGVSSLPTAVSTADDAVLGAATLQGQQLVVPTAAAIGGAENFAHQSGASNNSTNIKTSAGTIYDISIVNTTATLYYVKLYNLASAPTCSSATGFIESIPVPASTTGAGIVRTFPVGRAYSTGIGFCITAGGTSTDNTSAATGVFLSIGYK